MGQLTDKNMKNTVRIVNKKRTCYLDRYKYYDVTIDPDFILEPLEGEKKIDHMLRCYDILKGKTPEQYLRIAQDMK